MPRQWKGVKQVRAKGRLYCYHLKTMTRLPGEPGSLEFLIRLKQLEDRRPAPASAGTLGALIRAYRRSPEFAALSPRSREIYEGVIGELIKIQDAPLASLDSKFLYAARDKVLAWRKRAFANLYIKFLRSLLNWGIKRGKCDGNPALGIDLVPRPRNAPVINRPWSQEEIEAALATAPAPLRLAIALAAYTGLRESDVARVTWACYDGAAFEVRQYKTGATAWIPAHPRLQAILDATPRVSPQIVASSTGRPYHVTTLRARFFQFMAGLREDGKVGPGLSFHGLRHTLGTNLAEAGCDAGTIAAILGQKTTRMGEHYSRTANRRQLAGAGIARLK